MEFLKIIDKIFDNLNQNAIIATIFYIGVAYAERHELYCLQCLCQFVFILAVVSVSISLIVYTIEYSAKKCYKAISYKMTYNQGKGCKLEKTKKDEDMYQEL